MYLRSYEYYISKVIDREHNFIDLESGIHTQITG